MAMKGNKVKFVKFKRSGKTETDWFRVLVTIPLKRLEDHYFTVVPQLYVNAFHEIFTLLDFEITMEEEE